MYRHSLTQAIFGLSCSPLTLTHLRSGLLAPSKDANLAFNVFGGALIEQTFRWAGEGVNMSNTQNLPALSIYASDQLGA